MPLCRAFQHICFGNCISHRVAHMRGSSPCVTIVCVHVPSRISSQWGPVLVVFLSEGSLFVPSASSRWPTLCRSLFIVKGVMRVFEPTISPLPPQHRCTPDPSRRFPERATGKREDGALASPILFLPRIKHHCTGGERPNCYVRARRRQSRRKTRSARQYSSVCSLPLSQIPD